MLESKEIEGVKYYPVKSVFHLLQAERRKRLLEALGDDYRLEGDLVTLAGVFRLVATSTSLQAPTLVRSLIGWHANETLKEAGLPHDRFLLPKLREIDPRILERVPLLGKDPHALPGYTEGALRALEALCRAELPLVKTPTDWVNQQVQYLATTLEGGMSSGFNDSIWGVKNSPIFREIWAMQSDRSEPSPELLQEYARTVGVRSRYNDAAAQAAVWKAQGGFKIPPKKG